MKPGENFTIGSCITVEQGLELLKNDLSEATKCIERIVRVPLTDNQFGTLVSWTFNAGCGAAMESELVKKLNAGGQANEICNELRKWNKVTVEINGVQQKQISNGLIRRREGECTLFKFNHREINAKSLNFIKDFEKWEPCAHTNDGIGECIERIVRGTLTDNEFGALVSWTFTEGCAASTQSTLVRILNVGSGANEICVELRKDNKIVIKSVKVDGITTILTKQISNELIRRREDECALYKSNGDSPIDRFNMTCTYDADYLQKYPGNQPCIANYHNKEGMSCYYYCKFEFPKTCTPVYMSRRSQFC